MKAILKVVSYPSLTQPNSFGRGEFSPPPTKKRRTVYRDSGVKKTFCVGIVKNVPETHNNLVGMLDGFNLKKFGFGGQRS